MFSIIENFFSHYGFVLGTSRILLYCALAIIGYTVILNIIKRRPFGLLSRIGPLYSLPVGIILYLTNQNDNKIRKISKTLIFGSFWGLFYWIFLIDWYLIITGNDFGIRGLPNDIMGVFWSPIILASIAFVCIFLTPRIFRILDIEKFTQRVHLVRVGTILLISFVCFIIFWENYCSVWYLNRNDLYFNNFSTWIWSKFLVGYELLIIIKEFILLLIFTLFYLLTDIFSVIGSFTGDGVRGTFITGFHGSLMLEDKYAIADVWDVIYYYFKNYSLYLIPWISIPLISWGVRIKYLKNKLVLVKYKFVEKILILLCFIGPWIYWSILLEEINPGTILLKISTLHFLIGLSIGFIISFIISKAAPSFLTHFTPQRKLHQTFLKASIWGLALNIIIMTFVGIIDSSSLIDAMFMYLYIVLGICVLLIIFLPGRVRVWDMERFTQRIHLQRFWTIFIISFGAIIGTVLVYFDLKELLLMSVIEFGSIILDAIMIIGKEDSNNIYIISLISIPLVSWMVRIKYMKNVLVLVKYRFIEKILISLCFIGPVLGFAISLIVYKVFPSTLMHFKPKRKLYQGCLRSSLWGMLFNSITIPFIIMSRSVGVVDAMFIYLYILLGISILFIFITSIYHLIIKIIYTGWTVIKNLLIISISCASVVLISYVLAKNKVSNILIPWDDVSPTISHWVSTGIIMFTFLFLITILLILWSIGKFKFYGVLLSHLIVYLYIAYFANHLDSSIIMNWESFINYLTNGVFTSKWWWAATVSGIVYGYIIDELLEFNIYTTYNSRKQKKLING